MTQRRRLDSRFPFRERVGFRVKSSERDMQALARDISVGGVFIVHDPSVVQPGFELELQLPGSEGRLTVAGRVAHVITSAIAAAHGIDQGMGVQFEEVSEDQARAIAALVEEARSNDARRRIPKPASRAEPRPSPTDPILDYVLKFMDGTKPPELIAELSGVDVDAVIEAIHELLKLGMIELVAGAQAQDPASEEVIVVALDRLSSRTSVKGESLRPASIDSAVTDDIEARAAAMAQHNDYDVLGVTTAATTQEVRAAFLDRYSRYQAHASESLRMSVYGRKLETILQRLTDANATLSSPTARAEYDEYLGRCELLAAIDLGARVIADDDRAELWEQRARYEEKRRDTAGAANAWCRVFELRPNDLHCVQKAAFLILEAKLGTRRAQALAEHALSLAPNDSYNHRLLARVYLESGLRLRARRELQLAAKLERQGAVRSPAPPPERDPDAGSETK